MRVGFTGTRFGMSDKQKKELTTILNKIREDYICNFEECFREDLIAIDGGCIGSDYEFHQIAKSLKYVSVCYPGYSQKNPDDRSCRSDLSTYDEIEKEESFFTRNRKIVDDCHILIGAPYDNSQNGGTWYTINYARKVGKEYVILER